jgi:hypothetical protein
MMTHPDCRLPTVDERLALVKNPWGLGVETRRAGEYLTIIGSPISDVFNYNRGWFEEDQRLAAEDDLHG